MMYEVGKSFKGNSENLNIEIKGFIPAGQIVIGDKVNTYTVLINGNLTKISEQVLSLLIKKDVEKPLELPIVPKKERKQRKKTKKSK